MLRKWTMSNGLCVFHKEMATPLIAITVHIKGGSCVERTNEIGSAHFLEHMIYKASEKYPSEALISGLIEQEGAITNAMTSHERICFFIHTQSNVELMFDILSDGIKNPLFREDDIVVERGAVLQEIAHGDDDPDDMISKLYGKMIWGTHPYGEDIAGTPEQVSALTRDAFMDYHKKYFTPQNIVVSVAGGIKSEKVFELAFKYFGDDFHKAGQRARLPVVDFSYVPKSRLFLQENQLKQMKCAMGTLPQDWLSTKKGFEKSRVVASLLANILGGGMSSRLFLKTRGQKGLVYSIQSGISTYENAGNFWIDFGCDPANMLNVLCLTFDELDNILINGITESELMKAKNTYKTQVAQNMERSLSIAMSGGAGELQGLDLRESEEFFRDYIDPVNVVDVMDVAKALLPKTKYYLAVSGNVGDKAKELEKLLSL